MNEIPRFLTSKELARMCRVRLRTVEGWRRRGQGPEYEKLKTGQIRYPVKEVLRFIEAYQKSDRYSARKTEGKEVPK